MTTPTRANERGLTLTELTVVAVLASLVTLGLVAFYFNSQATWLDGSTQALTQREATDFLRGMTDLTRGATSAECSDWPDSLHRRLILRDENGNELWRLWWDSGDSLIHRGVGLVDQGPVVSSKAERFQVWNDTALVYLELLQLRSANGQRVQLSSSMALRNRR